MAGILLHEIILYTLNFMFVKYFKTIIDSDEILSILQAFIQKDSNRKSAYGIEYNIS